MASGRDKDLGLLTPSILHIQMLPDFSKIFYSNQTQMIRMTVISGQKASLSVSTTQLFKNVTTFPPYSTTNKGVSQRHCPSLSLSQHPTLREHYLSYSKAK